MIYLDGSSTSLVAVYSGDERYDELWVGDDKIWPDVESGDVGSGGGFIIHIPDAGTLDYLYWLHAVDASEEGNAGYMKFTVNGTDFYINSGPNGSEVVQLRGDTISLSRTQKELIWEYLGETICIHAEIQDRSSEQYEGTALCFLPYLKDTQLRGVFSKFKKDTHAGRKFTVSSRESGVVHYGGYWETSVSDRGKKTFILPMHSKNWEKRVYNNTMQVGDTMLQIETECVGSGRGGGVTLMWPAFRKDFELKVISFS